MNITLFSFLQVNNKRKKSLIFHVKSLLVYSKQLEAEVSQRLRIIVILGKVNSSGDVCVNGDNTGSLESMGTWGLVPTFGSS